jgi:NhaP-type Na+/H+ or K+/H+ antiporter
LSLKKETTLFILIGALSLGITIGWVVRYFLARLEKYDMKALSAIVSILTGGAVAHFLGGDPFHVAVWMYPVGLLVGVLAYPLIAKLDRD